MGAFPDEQLPIDLSSQLRDHIDETLVDCGWALPRPSPAGFTEAAPGIARATDDMTHGLAASIWTRDLGFATQAASRIKAGTLWMNTQNFGDPAVPFGGYKQSGEGRVDYQLRRVGALGKAKGQAGPPVGPRTKPAAAMRARTEQGRDRLPSCPHPVWSSIQFATGCRSDRGSRRSCHTPVR